MRTIITNLTVLYVRGMQSRHYNQSPTVMNPLHITATYVHHAPWYVRAACIASILAVAVYLYAIVSMVLYTSLHEEALADIRSSEHTIALLEAAYLEETHALSSIDAETFALVPATDVQYVDTRASTRLTRLD